MRQISLICPSISPTFIEVLPPFRAASGVLFERLSIKLFNKVVNYGGEWDEVGKFFYLSLGEIVPMLNLLGEYDCKLDDKGRMMFPAGLKKQLQEVLHEGFVVNRDMFESCLVLYPARQWAGVQGEINKLNRFVAKNVRFIRKFHNGATPVELDAAGRMLIPASLAGYAGITKEVKVTGSGDRIEIWDKAKYEAMLNDGEDMASLAEDVMGGVTPDGDGD